MDKNKKISVDTIITRNKDLDATDMDGELVMMDIVKGRYYGLNDVGSRIWEIIEKQLLVKEVIHILLEEFDVDDETCKSTVLNFLNGLYNEGVITIV